MSSILGMITIAYYPNILHLLEQVNKVLRTTLASD